MGKRGLSQIVTTIILILLILVAIGGIWAIVNNLIVKNSSKISTDSLTLSLSLKSAKIDYTTGLADVRVRRNTGAGNLVGIKFIAEDKRNSDVFEERFTSFPELAERTFTINLSQSQILDLPEIYKISIAPIFLVGGEAGSSGATGSGSEQIGSVSGTITGLNEGVNVTINDPQNNDITCSSDNDCPTDYLISGTEVCDDSGTKVMQYKKDYYCVTGGFSFCDSNNIKVIVEDCPTGTLCYDGACIEQLKTCTNQTVADDCGTDQWVGTPECSATQNDTIIQDYKTYACNDGNCSSSTTSQIKGICPDGQICHEGQCLTSLECTNNYECDFGEVCKDGSCVPEEMVVNGTIRSVWPYGVGEYFDSFQLPTDPDAVAPGSYVIFPGNQQTSCLRVREFQTATFDGGISYIRVDQVPSNLSDGDDFEVWETNYGCTMI